jgi:hypothetical protein
MMLSERMEVTDMMLDRVASGPRILVASLAALLVCLLITEIAVGAIPCDNLRSLALLNTTITAAELVTAGPFHAPGTPAPPPVTLPAHCRVAAMLTP